MGTRSTVKFVNEGQNILSVYQQYDGYPSGVGQQIVDLLDKYEIVNGLSLNNSTPVANGFAELALLYVLDNKEGNGNIYATTFEDSQEFDYEIHGTWSDVKSITVFEDGSVIFKGDKESFKQFVSDSDY